ncbi:MAG: DUF5320 domain-containing protein [Candidatus Omnitrophica bacterium]|nr:DUF5320 domain-containing protein [Candidatus Omnitrophota bacterium]
MPGFDGTGPMGIGPMTGGGRGCCAVPFSGAGTRPFAFSRGFLGRGGGRGRRNWYYATGLSGWQRASMRLFAFGGWVDPAMYPYGAEVTPKQEADILKSEADILKKQLGDIQSRIEILEKGQAQEGKNE